MITRAIQRSNQGMQSIAAGEKVLFNRSILSWTATNTTLSPITYSSGIFRISSASSNDYMVSIEMSVATATKADYFDSNFLIQMGYGDGDVTQDCFCSSINTLGAIHGFKIIHIIRKSSNDVLSINITSRVFYSTIYLAQTKEPLPTGKQTIDICNANICIFSI